MNKKGQFEVAKTSLFWVVIVFVLTIVIIAFALIINNFHKRVVDVPAELQVEMIALRFANVPECFAYSVNDIVQPGVIDLDKFTDEQMLKCYRTENKNTFNFRLVLQNSGKQVMSNNYFNKDDFTIFKQVLIRDGSELKSDKMAIYVQEKIR
jgi:hypothetical protein